MEIMDKAAEDFVATFINFAVMATDVRVQQALVDPAHPGHEEVTKTYVFLKAWIPKLQERMGAVALAMGVTEFQVNPQQLMQQLMAGPAGFAPGPK